MEKLTYIQDRFCWSQTDFPEWDALLPEKAVIQPYSGWTPPLVVGADQRFWEIHPGNVSEQIGLASPYGFIRKDGMAFTLQAGKIVLERQYHPEAAIHALLRWAGDTQAYTPQFLYRKPEGRLEKLLNDSDSTLVLLCGWKDYRRECYELKALSWENKINAGLLLNDSDRIMDEYRRDQEQRTPESRFSYGEKMIPIRTEEYAPADYRYDSILKVLDPSCWDNATAVEYFKLKQLELAERNDLDAIFVKQRRQCYALGCRHAEFLGEFNGFQLRQIANYREKLPLEQTEPKAALFEFLKKVKNNHYVLTHHPDFEPQPKFIDESLPRLFKKLQSMTEAMHYYAQTTPFRRCQWTRHTL